jgi:NAD(P)-dependent dehydrogenase (short-subunit alcohol dehydrogenase family)
MSLFALQGRVALITGGNGGIGLGMAQGLAEAGAAIAVAGRDVAKSQSAAAALASHGGKTAVLEVDVADEASCRRMVKEACERLGRLDILINNAGIATVSMRIHEMPVADWDRLMAINLRSVFLCSRALIPMMLTNGSGSIINIASIVGLVGNYPGFAMNGANYAAAKAGVIGFTRQMAAEYAKDGIRANAIAPGWHGGTRLAEERKATATPAEIERFEETILRGTPMGRRGRPEELQGMAIYLASDASRYVTGQVFTQDGGWTAV